MTAWNEDTITNPGDDKSREEEKHKFWIIKGHNESTRIDFKC